MAITPFGPPSNHVVCVWVQPVRADRLPFVLAPLEADRPEVMQLAADPQVSQSFASAERSAESVAVLVDRLGPSLRQFLHARP